MDTLTIMIVAGKPNTPECYSAKGCLHHRRKLSRHARRSFLFFQMALFSNHSRDRISNICQVLQAEQATPPVLDAEDMKPCRL